MPQTPEREEPAAFPDDRSSITTRAATARCGGEDAAPLVAPEDAAEEMTLAAFDAIFATAETIRVTLSGTSTDPAVRAAILATALYEDAGPEVGKKELVLAGHRWMGVGLADDVIRRGDISDVRRAVSDSKRRRDASTSMKVIVREGAVIMRLTAWLSDTIDSHQGGGAA